MVQYKVFTSGELLIFPSVQAVKMPSTVYGAPATRNEIIELAVQEGHDADISTNIGVISNPEKYSSSARHESVTDKEMEVGVEKDVEKDLEKNDLSAESLSAAETDEDTSEPSDPNIVWWDGPTDPQNPMNWSWTKKWGTIMIVSAITFLTPLASSMFAPGIPDIMKEFHSTNSLLEGFMLSVYVLGFVFGPLSRYCKSCQRRAILI